MRDSNNQNPNIDEKAWPLTPEEDNKETERLKAFFENDFYKSTYIPNQTTNIKKNKKKRLPNNDGVKIPGVCPYCGGKLSGKSDLRGKLFTVCEHYNIECPFYVPYKKGHF
jgi:hypothetical protein